MVFIRSHSIKKYFLQISQVLLLFLGLIFFGLKVKLKAFVSPNSFQLQIYYFTFKVTILKT